jgi:hypothetical protein
MVWVLAGLQADPSKSKRLLSFAAPGKEMIRQRGMRTGKGVCSYPLFPVP